MWWITVLWLLSIWVICILIGLSIASAVLKLACALAGAEVPDTGKAMVTSVLESLFGALVRYIVFTSLAYSGFQAYIGVQDALTAYVVIGVVIAFVVPAGIYMPMLRVSFGRGLVITLLRYVITAVAVVGVAYLLMAMTGKDQVFRYLA